jgi:hypothetical protein
MTQESAALQKYLLLNQKKINPKKKIKVITKKENLYIKILKNATNSQILSAIKYSQSYPASLLSFKRTES